MSRLIGCLALLASLAPLAAAQQVRLEREGHERAWQRLAVDLELRGRKNDNDLIRALWPAYEAEAKAALAARVARERAVAAVLDARQRQALADRQQADRERLAQRGWRPQPQADGDGLARARARHRQLRRALDAQLRAAQRPTLEDFDSLEQVGVGPRALTEELGLSEAQQPALRRLLAEAIMRFEDDCAAQSKGRRGMFGSASVQLSALARVQAQMKTKLAAILDPAQRQRLEGFSVSWMGVMRRKLQAQARRRAPTAADRARAILEYLAQRAGLARDEAAAILPLLTAVLQHRGEAGQREAELVRAIHDPESERSLADRAAALRRARARAAAKAETLAAALREVLSLEQELLLVAEGVLR